MFAILKEQLLSTKGEMLVRKGIDFMDSTKLLAKVYMLLSVIGGPEMSAEISAVPRAKPRVVFMS